MDEDLYERIETLYYMLQRMYREYSDEDMKYLKKPYQLIIDFICDNFVELVKD